MYAYDWDKETGGYVLNTTQLAFSKEPRPVYYKELDILGFDKIWDYDKDDSFPYMWAEANNYIYRGRVVAKTRGGAIDVAPSIVEIEPPETDGGKLLPVDIAKMVTKNDAIMESLTQSTIKKVYNTYVDYRDKVDVFYVAFSGGKDSIALLDIVQQALPHSSFKVLFGDTGMEFPDTYSVVRNIEQFCIHENIEFINAHSHLMPKDSWQLFGPPATVTRWCCSVHKTTPQIIALRENLKINDFTGMAFIGIRADESLARSEYDYISLGEKHKGQYSCNPILEWNSAELFLHIYKRGLVINECYKKGNRRAGCLVCPRAAERNDYMNHHCYQKEADGFYDLIRKQYRGKFKTEEALDSFISVGGWKARKNGRDLSVISNYTETVKKGENTVIKIKSPKTDWHEWIKTIGVLLTTTAPYSILFRGQELTFDLNEVADDLVVSIDANVTKENPLFVKLLKNVFRKAACCVGCRECEADCHNGNLHLRNGKVEVSDDCTHCAQCHKVEKGCLVYKSLEMPKGGIIAMDKNSLNCYCHFAPKREWFDQYFEYKNDFSVKHSLGSQMYSFFKRFLRDAELLDSNGFTRTAELIERLGLEDLASWGIMLTNLSYTPQIQWYIKKTMIGENYPKNYLISMLIDDGAKESWVNDIWSSLVRLLDLPLGKVGLGYATKEKEKVVSLTRNNWESPIPLVVLYSLYRFAEACGDYYQFTLSRLLNQGIDSDGVSPTEVFGIDREAMERIVTGLSVNYPDYISSSFTLDLDNITLRKEKTSSDVLELF